MKSHNSSRHKTNTNYENLAYDNVEKRVTMDLFY